MYIFVEKITNFNRYIHVYQHPVYFWNKWNSIFLNSLKPRTTYLILKVKK